MCRFSRWLTLLAAALGMVIPGCIGSGQLTAKVVQSSVQRDTSPSVQDDELEELVSASNRLTFDLYQQIRHQAGNLVYSPYSLSIGLAQVYAGARGNTASQMANTLYYDLLQTRVHPTFNALDLGLENHTPGFELLTVNALWGQEGYSFHQEYLDLIAENYGTGLRLVDFEEADDRERARLAINNWASEHTRGKIAELVAQEVLRPETRLVIANATYFEAEWSQPFDNTQEDLFTLLDGSQIVVDMMDRRASTLYAEGPGYQAVGLPYKSDRARMVILLALQDQFESLEQLVDVELITTVLQELDYVDMKLYLPEFDFAASPDFVQPLRELGMVDLFVPADADLSGMNDAGGLFISQIIHKAFITVNRRGTTATAASGMQGEVVCGPQVVVRADRPFVFAIYDVETGAILFVGRVLDPR